MLLFPTLETFGGGVMPDRHVGQTLTNNRKFKRENTAFDCVWVGFPAFAADPIEYRFYGQIKEVFSGLVRKH